MYVCMQTSLMYKCMCACMRVCMYVYMYESYRLCAPRLFPYTPGCRPETRQRRRRARGRLRRGAGCEARPLQVDQRHDHQAAEAHRALSRSDMQ